MDEVATSTEGTAPAAAGSEEPAKELIADVMGEPSRTISQTISRTTSRKTMETTERVDVDRTTLDAILDVSSRIQDIQKRSRMSMSTLGLAQESYKDKQVS